MKKIVELLIHKDEFELDELGVDVLSLVKDPAIGYEWFAFSEEDCEECGDFLEENPCTAGYVAYGMKPKGGRMVPNCVPVDASMQFESITDYPEYIKEAAAKGIRLNLEVNNKCMTQVGKVRAQQLAQGKPISEETIRRMYSYLSRAMTYFDPSDNTKCGTIAIYGWGGPEALKWAEKKVESFDKERIQNAIVLAAEDLGEEHDLKNTTYLEERAGKFEFAEDSVAGIADAVKALDILSKRASTEESKIVYKYEGPITSNSRKFCRAMVGLSRTKVFTRQEINQMTTQGVNADFNSPIRSGNYDIFKFAGGANCQHHWAEYKMFKGSGNKTILIKNGVETETPATRTNSGFVNQTQKKKADQWAAINLSRQEFRTINEDERIVVAPSMVPNVLIKRRNQAGEEYFVYFSEDTIKDIAEKYFKNNYQNNTDIDHNGDISTSNTLLESWIVEDPEKDKSAIYGFDVPKGTWMISMRINDTETWNKIQAGDLRGYSISGNFIEMTK